MLTVSAADVDVVLASDGSELVHIGGKLGELDVNGGAHAGSEVGGAGGDVTKMLVVGESSLGLDNGSSLGESLEDLADVGSLLHGDDTELVLFVDPDEEGLLVVVEDTTGFGPLTLETARLKVLVAALEKEVILDERFTIGVAHGSEGVVLALEFTCQGVESRDDLGLNLAALLSSAGSAEGVVGEVPGDSDSGRVDHAILVSGEVGALQLSVVHV